MYAAPCDYCGVYWHRSDLTLNDEGLYACPDDRDGKTSTTLNEELLASDPIQVRGKTRE